MYTHLSHTGAAAVLLDHLVLVLAHVLQTAVRVSGTKVLMVRAHAHRHTAGIAGHLVRGATHGIGGHLYLALMPGRLLVKVLHLTVVRWIVVLAVVVVRRRVMTVGLPVEGIVRVVLITQWWIARRSYRRGGCCYHTARIATERCHVSIYTRVRRYLR